MDKIIFTDLDGTLFYPKKRFRMIPSASKRFLRRFIDDGGKVVLVSSRSPRFMEKVERKLDRKVDFIGCNGAFIMQDGKMIKNTFFNPGELNELIACLRDEFNPSLFLLTTPQHPLLMTKTRTNKWTKFCYILYQTYQGVLKDESYTSDQLFYNEINKGNAYKLMVLIGITKGHIRLAERITKKLQEKYKDYDICWLGEFIEITPKGCNKASGISFYLDYNKISKDNVLVVGDSGNDIPMFQAFKEGSYCMDHGPESVKKNASHVIKRFADLEKALYPSADSK